MINRTGKFMYVVNDTTNPGSISAFTITSSTGALAPIGSPTPIGNTIDSANPQAQILVVPGGDNTISTFTIDPSAGTLALVAPATSVTGAVSLDNAVVDPTGKCSYVIDFDNGSTAGQIFAFSITAGGVIGAQIGTALPTGIAPGLIVIDSIGVLIATENNGDTHRDYLAPGSGNWRRYNGHYRPQKKTMAVFVDACGSGC
jgi:hypothetical protein